MPTSAAFLDHCLELLAGHGVARSKRMFGGHALYLDDLTVALVLADTLYLKADAQTAERFQAAGCKPFQYQRRDEAVIMTSYWSAPEEALESPALLGPWLQCAKEAALRARTTKPRSKAPAASRRR